jgi:hypothetical protein
MSSDDHRDSSSLAALPPAPPGGGGRGLGFAGFGGFEHGAAARGAGVVREEPGVDAADVEAVGAARQDAHLLAVRELAEADGADVGGDGRGPVGAARAVHLHGDAPERAPLEPSPPAAGPGAGLRLRRAARPADEAPRQLVEPEREEEREEQRGEDDDHVGVEAGVAAPRAAAQRVLRPRDGAPGRRRLRRAQVPAHRPPVHAHGRRRSISGHPPVHHPPLPLHLPSPPTRLVVQSRAGGTGDAAPATTIGGHHHSTSGERSRFALAPAPYLSVLARKSLMLVISVIEPAF